MLVYYYATYCGWCKKFDPTWVRLIERMGKKKEGYLIKIEKSFMGDDLKCKQDISSFPTILYMKKGALEDLYQGDRSLSSLVAFIKKNSGKTLTPRRTLRTPRRTPRTPRIIMQTPRMSPIYYPTPRFIRPTPKRRTRPKIRRPKIKRRTRPKTRRTKIKRRRRVR